MIQFAIQYKKPVRIGVNWGSLDQDLLAKMMDANKKLKEPLSSNALMREALIQSALLSAKSAEDIGLSKEYIIISCKTSDTQDLIYVSPKSGRAVSRKAAGEWKDRLLPLPSFLRNKFEAASREDLLDSLKTTGHFLTTWLAESLGERQLPEARSRLIVRLENKKYN